MATSDDDTKVVESAEPSLIARGFVAALDTLPALTRAVFLLASKDHLSYEEIGWRCGISVDEVMIRAADALSGIRRDCYGRTSLLGRLRSDLGPWRATWMRWRLDRRHRALGITPVPRD